jgi:hypothetical protein
VAFNHILPIMWVLKIYNIGAYEASVTQSDDSDRLIQSILKVEE